MYLEWIEIQNYRNLEYLRLDFHKNVNFLVGENAVGKTNFLELLEYLIKGKAFEANDFYDVEQKVTVTVSIAFSTEELPALLQDVARNRKGHVTLYFEQSYRQDNYPSVYVLETDLDGGTPHKRFLSKSLRTMMMFLFHRSIRELETPHTKGLVDFTSTLEHVIEELRAQVGKLAEITDANEEGIPEKYIKHLGGPMEVVTQFHGVLERFIHVCNVAGTETLSKLDGRTLDNSLSSLVDRYTKSNLYLAMTIMTKVLWQLFQRETFQHVKLSDMAYVDREGRKTLSLFLCIDGPEINLGPFQQRAVIRFYEELLNNKNPEFLYLLNKLFGIQALTGQLFIITNSTDSLEDDYKRIIRFYRNSCGHTRVACGTTFELSLAAEKTLSMYFGEAKAALFSSCTLLVEGETELGSFPFFAKTMDIDFSYYRISLINARGQGSINSLEKLLRHFHVKVVTLYDRDVKRDRSANKNRFFTQGVCYEYDLVAHLLQYPKGRDILNSIFNDVATEQYNIPRTKHSVSLGKVKSSLQKIASFDPDFKAAFIQAARNSKNTSIRNFVTSHASTSDQIIINDLGKREGAVLTACYFAWLFSVKGVGIGWIVGAHLNEIELIPPAFRAPIARAAELALREEDVE